MVAFFIAIVYYLWGMAFSRKEYRMYKDWMQKCINHNYTYVTAFYNQISGAIHDEDFELAQAIKDVLIEWLNKHSDDNISKNVLMRIPEYKKCELFKCTF